MFPIKSCYLAVLLLAACSVLTHCALDAPALGNDAAYADNADDKMDDALTVHKRPSFFVGSRYGRSGAAGSGAYASSKTRRLNVVPRNDRFFLGSRYGKRAGEYSSPYEQDTNELSADATVGAIGGGAHADNRAAAYYNTNNNNNNNGNTGPFMMSCVYLGVRNIYRCSSIDEINNIINQLTTAQTEDAKK